MQKFNVHSLFDFSSLSPSAHNTPESSQWIEDREMECIRSLSSMMKNFKKNLSNLFNTHSSSGGVSGCCKVVRKFHDFSHFSFKRNFSPLLFFWFHRNSNKIQEDFGLTWVLCWTNWRFFEIHWTPPGCWCMLPWRGEWRVEKKHYKRQSCLWNIIFPITHKMEKKSWKRKFFHFSPKKYERKTSKQPSLPL